MSDDPDASKAGLVDANGATFLLRWRGRQEGPYTPAAIEAKLAANQIGLLHEILSEGRWVAVRDYLAAREALVCAQRQAREDQQRFEREATEQQAKKRDEKHQAEFLAEERRRNELPQADIAERRSAESSRAVGPIARKPHRAGVILALGIIGLFVCGPLCLAAWTLGSSDLSEMNAGIMDDSGRATTSTGRTLGMVGTLLWAVGVVAYCLI